MCQSKKDGGARCGYHLRKGVSEAMTSLASSVTGLDRAETTAVMTALAAEGAHAPEPSREQVDAFLHETDFRVRNDVMIPQKKKVSILGRLRAAVGKVTPDGATFHAWRNAVAGAWSAVKKRRSAIVGIGAAAVLATSMTACSASADHAGVCVDKTTQTRIDDKNCDDDSHYAGGHGWYYIPMNHSAPAVGKRASGGSWTVPKGHVGGKGGVSVKGGTVKAGGFHGSHGSFGG